MDIRVGGPGAAPDASDPDFLKSILDSLQDGVYYVDADRQVTYWNKGAERISGFSKSEVVGRHCWDNILGHVDERGNSLCLAGCTLACTLSDGCEREIVAYLRHKAGHRVPVQIRVVPIRDREGRVTGAVEIFSDDFTRAESRRRIRELEKMAYLDELTGLANRRFVDIGLQQALSEMERYGWPFGVVMMDLDDFKGTNNQHGHCTGDEVLRMVSRTLERSSRPSDVIGRWGGDEFLAIVKNAGEEELKTVAEKYRHLVGSSRLDAGGQAIRVGLSAGAASALSGDTPQSLVARADEALYRGKKGGARATEAAHSADAPRSNDPQMIS